MLDPIGNSRLNIRDSLAPPAHPARSTCAGQVAGVAIPFSASFIHDGWRHEKAG
jgi:hypothetical protein